MQYIGFIDTIGDKKLVTSLFIITKLTPKFITYWDYYGESQRVKRDSTEYTIIDIHKKEVIK